MTTDRPYRPARPVPEAIEELRTCSGSQFDPVVVEALIEVIGQLPERDGANPGPAPDLGDEHLLPSPTPEALAVR
jgi:HD-GYP domain-containing protein (c-di-GMP phosphodiesterase class II)